MGGSLALTTIRCGPVGNEGSPAPSSEGGAPGEGGVAGNTGNESGSGASSGGAGSDAAPGGGMRDGGGAPQDSGSSDDAGPARPGLRVSGNRLVDNGSIVRLLGVNHSGSEYQCINTSNSIFEGPSDATLVSPMKAWNVNTVRVPLNEDCWLGINGIASAVGGPAYQQAIAAFVRMLRSSGMYVVVDLHWNGPGTMVSKSQQPMPDADHAEDFWKSVAATFKSDLGIVFDLYNEPYPDKMPGGASNVPDCMLNGCSLSNWSDGQAHQAVGMQQLVTDVRATGAQNVIMIGGVAYANALGQWLQFKPVDPLNNIAASFHNYSFNSCNSATCWGSTVGAVAAQVPVVTGELGENDCAGAYVDSYFTWADSIGVSYLGWSWNAQSCTSFPALITDYSGTATGFGQAFKSHLPTQ